jgi:hypothetical protein
VPSGVLFFFPPLEDYVRQTLVSMFVREGGHYRQAAIDPPRADESQRLAMISASNRQHLRAERYACACGVRLPNVFPQILGARIFPTRHEVFFSRRRRATPESSPACFRAELISTRATASTDSRTSRAAA